MMIDVINYDFVYMFMNIGSFILGCFVMGLWLIYGFGVEVDDLFGFVVFIFVGWFG